MREKETKMIEKLEKISNAFGPSGFEEEVVKTIAEFCTAYETSNDTMNNLYIKHPANTGKKPVVMLDAHLDECGFLVQAVKENGLLSMLALGGWDLTNIPAHSVIIRNRKGEKIKGITTSRPVHFMSEQERNAPLNMESIFIDVGASSKKEVEEVYGIYPGDPVMPDVSFEYHEKTGVCYGKAFDNRVGCTCILETMERLLKEKDLPVDVVGAFAAQEEVGTRGAEITTQTVKPDFAIVFEGSPADDFYYGKELAQGVLKKGVQIRHRDASHITNPVFIQYAHELAEAKQIPYQDAVRRNGGTNAGKISLKLGPVPVLVLGIPSRYVHTHYNFCAKQDIDAAVALAVEVIKQLNQENQDRITKKHLI